MINFSKINLFKREWIDTVFAERNKEYGAYDLRKREASITIKSTIIGVVIFSLLVSLPLLVKKIGVREGSGSRTIDETVTIVDLLPPPEQVEQTFVPPPPPTEVQSIKDIKKFTPPVVAPENEVVEDMVSQEVLKTADAGSRNVDASEDGEIVIDETPVEHEVVKKVVEDNTPVSMKNVQVQPEYPGGMQEFVRFVISSLDGINVETSGDLRLEFRFVIEKDGSLTDIQTVNDGGYPEIAQIAANVLKRSKKWSPGINNGKPVRVAYAIPITVRVQ